MKRKLRDPEKLEICELKKTKSSESTLDVERRRIFIHCWVVQVTTLRKIIAKIEQRQQKKGRQVIRVLSSPMNE